MGLIPPSPPIFPSCMGVKHRWKCSTNKLLYIIWFARVFPGKGVELVCMRAKEGVLVEEGAQLNFFAVLALFFRLS